MTRDGPSTRTILHVILVILAVLLLLWIVWQARGILTWIMIAAFLATAMNPLVNLFQHRLRLRRAAAVGMVYVLGAGVLAGAAFLLVPPLVDAAQEAIDELPSYVAQLEQSDLVQELDQEYDLLNQLEEEGTTALEGIAGPDAAFELARRVASGLLALISIAVITFLLSLYGPRIRSWTLGLFEGSRRERLDRVAHRMYRVISGYVVGVFLVALTAGLAVWLFLTILDVPFAALLGFWAGLASLLPLIGATIGGAPYVIVAFFQGWPTGVAAIAFLIVYQQIENNVFQPAIHRFTVQLNPLWIILAVLVGATILGVLGALLAIPIAGIIQVLVQEWWSTRRPAALTPTAAEEPPPP